MCPSSALQGYKISLIFSSDYIFLANEISGFKLLKLCINWRKTKGTFKEGKTGLFQILLSKALTEHLNFNQIGYGRYIS